MAIENQNYDPAAKYGGEWVTNDLKAESVTGPKIAATAVSGSQLATAKGYFAVSVRMPPNTTEQNVFGTDGLGVASTLTAAIGCAMDETAVSVSIVGGSSSIGTIVLTSIDGTGAAKGPDTDLQSAALTAGTKLFLANNVEGEVQVTLTFEVD